MCFCLYNFLIYKQVFVLFACKFRVWENLCPFGEFLLNLKFVWDMLIFPLKFKVFPNGILPYILKAIGLNGDKAPLRNSKNVRHIDFFELLTSIK